MKRVKNITMAALITVIGSGWAMAQGVSTTETSKSNQEVRVIPRADARYKLVYPVNREETVWIKIYDSEQHLLLSERIRNQEGFMKSYDFSNLAEGLYTLKIYSDGGITTREVYHTYKKNDLKVSVDRNVNNNSLDLVVRGVRRDPVYVDILNGKDEVVFEDIVEVGKNFSRVYKFAEKMPEDISLRISTEQQTVIKEVK